jgi:hypothetical protein
MITEDPLYKYPQAKVEQDHMDNSSKKKSIDTSLAS